MDKNKVLDFLNNLQIEYDFREHPAAVDKDSCAYVDEILPSTPCKNLFLTNRAQTEFYLLMMPRAKDFRTRYLKEQLGLSHLSFASEDHMVNMLDVKPGSVSVMCLLNEAAANIHFILDEDVIKGDTVRFHVGDNTATARVKKDDFLNVVIPALKHEPTYINIVNE